MNLHTIIIRLGETGSFDLTENVFLRCLGLVYACAFGSLWPQILGLIGSHGITPAISMMSAVRAEVGTRALLYLPSVLWIQASDGALTMICALGCLASLLLVGGLLSRWAALLCFILYLSLVSVGQPFTSFQWDALLLEAGFLAIFAGAPWLAWAYRFLLFRLMFESGFVKLASHDVNWRDFHALRFHFLTQPLPNPVAYYTYFSPAWLLDSLTAVTLAIELVAPLLLFCPRRVRHLGLWLLMFLQVAIILTGNYAFFNLLTLALCLWGFDDQVFAPLSRLLQRRIPVTNRPVSRRAVNALNAAVGVLVVLAALQPLGQLAPEIIRSRVAQPAWLQSFEIVNGYGLFATMTTTRAEIVIEGSDDGKNWREYSFRYKPGNLHRELPMVAPYQPRLDWQMWFAALGNFQNNTWVGNLMTRLLEGDQTVIGLMEPPPFPNPPRYLRALIYNYTFATPQERTATGAIWRRELLGTWFGPVSLKL